MYYIIPSKWRELWVIFLVTKFFFIICLALNCAFKFSMIQFCRKKKYFNKVFRRNQKCSLDCF